MLFRTNNFQRFSVRIFHLLTRTSRYNHSDFCIYNICSASTSCLQIVVVRLIDVVFTKYSMVTLCWAIFNFTGLSFTYNIIHILPPWSVKGRNESVYNNCFTITICNNDASTRALRRYNGRTLRLPTFLSSFIV